MIKDKKTNNIKQMKTAKRTKTILKKNRCSNKKVIRR